MSTHHDDYLWDPAAEPHPDVQHFERALAGARLLRPLNIEALPERDVPLRLGADGPPSRAQAPRARPARLWAAAALLALATLAALVAAPRQTSAWTATPLAGAPAIGDRALASSLRLRPGRWLTTDSRSTAALRAPGVGSVTVQPGSRIRLARSERDHHLLDLRRGTIAAIISAPPRVFLVDTPAGRAVDMGCEYTLSVDDSGLSTLSVSFGYVMLEGQPASHIPAGATCITRPGSGPGLPIFDDAPADFRAAAAMFDTGRSRAWAIRTMLASARARDAMTLWHVLQRIPAASRPAVYDRLASLDPPPQGVARAGVLAGDPAMLEAWWRSLKLH
jgi:hypothetical protein